MFCVTTEDKLPLALCHTSLWYFLGYTVGENIIQMGPSVTWKVNKTSISLRGKWRKLLGDTFQNTAQYSWRNTGYKSQSTAWIFTLPMISLVFWSMFLSSLRCGFLICKRGELITISQESMWYVWHSIFLVSSLLSPHTPWFPESLHFLASLLALWNLSIPSCFAFYIYWCVSSFNSNSLCVSYFSSSNNSYCLQLK